jgi:hypothetical protein
MIPLPSARDLALIPPSSSSLDQMTTLLLLILGAAVQSDQKQEVTSSFLLALLSGMWSKVRGNCYRYFLQSANQSIRVVDPDPDSVTLWIRIRIGDPDPGARKFQWKNALFI